MGLDVYVGSFTRYYSGNWETVIQTYGREKGLDIQVVRSHEPADVVTNPEEIRPAVLAWRDQLSQGLGSNIVGRLDWDETDAAPYFTDKPSWDCYSALLLWAAYAEHPGLPRPVDFVEDWTTDPAVQKSQDTNFKTAFPQLLRDVEIWLPHDFSFTFQAADLTGTENSFGSSVALLVQLEELNRRTWTATEPTRLEWQREGASQDAPLEIRAGFAFAIITELARQAVAHRLIMKLDY